MAACKIRRCPRLASRCKKRLDDSCRHRPNKSGVSFQLASIADRKLEAYATLNATVIDWPILGTSNVQFRQNDVYLAFAAGTARCLFQPTRRQDGTTIWTATNSRVGKWQRMTSSIDLSNSGIVLVLLDSDATTSAREWRFTVEETVQIGRSPDNDVVLDDRHVSRFHSTLFYKRDHWKCASFGTNKAYVDGEKVSHARIKDGTVVQFARSGPRVHFEVYEVEVAEADDDSEHMVTAWIDELKTGSGDAAQRIWERYFQRVVQLARNRMGHSPRRAADEEDVGLSVLDSLCQGVAEGRFPELANRDNLWRLLVVMTARKTINLIHHERRQKRGGGTVRGDSIMPQSDSDSSPPGFDRFMTDEPTPEFAAQVTEEAERRLQSLGDETLRSIAIWKMEGYTNEEIAGMLNCTPRTVERKLQAIRSNWSQAASNNDVVDEE